jgi:integrase
LVRRLWGGIDSASWRAGLWLWGRRRNGDVADRSALGLMPVSMRQDGKLVSGRNGRLFLANDTYGVILQHSGDLMLSDHQVGAWRALLHERADRLEEIGCSYLMAVAPNAHSVYPEDLPSEVTAVGERPVHRLLSSVAENGSSDLFLYLGTDLLERKREREVFPRTETHWNEFGAFVAYRAIARALRSRGVEMRVVGDDDVRFHDVQGVGDLGLKRRWPRTSSHAIARLLHPTAELVEDNLVDGLGTLLVTESRVAEPSTCVICGDSYTVSMLPFFAESFGRVVFARTPALDLGLIERERPSVVITVISERFLIGDPPHDDSAASAAELATANVAAGRVRSAPWNRFDVKRHVAPAEIEWIRARLLAEGRLRDATMVSLLAYSGVRPDELERFRWRNVLPGALQVRTAPPGDDGRTPAREWPWRNVPLVRQLEEDLAAWRAAAPATDRKDLVFPAVTEGTWDREWRRWANEVYAPLARELGLDPPKPGRLGRTFVALRIYAGATAADLAQELGWSLEEAQMAHACFRDAHRDPVSPAAEIARARRLAAPARTAVSFA